MQRRVASLLRVTLFVLGLGALLWLPASWHFVAFLNWAQLLDGTVVASHRGSMVVYAREQDAGKWFHDSSAGIVRESDFNGYVGFDGSVYLLPRLGRHEFGGLTSIWLSINIDPHTMWIGIIPLWLLAFLCLAWPVTSFLLSRRRRGRGFPVGSALFSQHGKTKQQPREDETGASGNE